jgi:hypothetical protein
MKPSRLPLIVLACIAAVAVLIGSYMGGYLALSTAYSVTLVEDYGDPYAADRPVLLRRFPARWLAVLFQPAASIESRLRQKEVVLEPLDREEIAL